MPCLTGFDFRLQTQNHEHTDGLQTPLGEKKRSPGYKPRPQKLRILLEPAGAF